MSDRGSNDSPESVSLEVPANVTWMTLLLIFRSFYFSKRRKKKGFIDKNIIFSGRIGWKVDEVLSQLTLK